MRCTTIEFEHHHSNTSESTKMRHNSNNHDNDSTDVKEIICKETLALLLSIVIPSSTVETVLFH